MFERFTDEARQAVVSAQEQARLLQHNHIGTEHVLLSLFTVPDSAAGRALHKLGLTRKAVVSDVETIVGRGTGTSSGHIPFTPRAKKVLELALREALTLRHNYIATEHVLLGILREGEGVAAQILTRRVRDLTVVRGAVLSELGTAAEADALGSKATQGQPISSSVAPKKVTTAAEEAIAAAEALAGGAPMGSHHLLEALARAEGSMAGQALAALGVAPDAIANRVDELDPEATTDASPEESAARKMELRVEQGEVHLVFRDEVTVELARQIVDLAGGPVPGTGPVTGAFVPLWTSTNDVLLVLLRALRSEPDDDASEVASKASVMLRRVMRSRLQQRLRRPKQPE
jgi:ATP-dependent Clp protease ATP-binding subunit ClpC